MAEVDAPRFAEVTPKSFSVVWTSEDPVEDATVLVFLDADAQVEAGGEVDVVLASDATALANGVVRATVTGVVAGQTLYIQTITATQNEILSFPELAPLPEVGIPVSATKTASDGHLIVNDLVAHDLLAPDGANIEGALLLVESPGNSRYPVSAFAGEGFALPRAVADLNNLFTPEGTSIDLPANAVLQMTELRGRTCPFEEQQMVRFRRLSADEQSPPLINVQQPVLCFFADTLCDDVINILDVQRVLNRLGHASGECAFNPDLDVNGDAVINILDAQAVLNRFGQEGPF